MAVAGHVAAKYLLMPFLQAGTENGLWVKVLAAFIIAFVTLPNLFGHQQSAWTQNLTTILKLGLFTALVAFAFLYGRGQMSRLCQGQSIEKVGLGECMTQLFFVMFAYSGWNAASYMAGEVKDPGNTLPRSLICGTALVTLLYLLLVLVFAYAVPLSEVNFDNPTQIPALAVKNLFGIRISNVFSILLGLTFLSTVSAFVITGPRIYYAMARDGLFPSVAGRISKKTGVPVYAMIAQSLCSITVLFMTDFENLYKYASVGLSIFALLFINAVYVLRRKKPNMQRPFSVPGYPVVPGLFMVSILFMAIFAFKQWPGPSIFSLISILIGIPIYYIWSSIRTTASQ